MINTAFYLHVTVMTEINNLKVNGKRSFYSASMHHKVFSYASILLLKAILSIKITLEVTKVLKIGFIIVRH